MVYICTTEKLLSAQYDVDVCRKFEELEIGLIFTHMYKAVIPVARDFLDITALPLEHIYRDGSHNEFESMLLNYMTKINEFEEYKGNNATLFVLSSIHLRDKALHVADELLILNEIKKGTIKEV